MTVNQLIEDLPLLNPGDQIRWSEYRTPLSKELDIDTHPRNGPLFVTLNYTRWHNERDLNIYRRAIELWVHKGERLHYDDLPEELKTHKNRKAFADRYKVVDGEGKSHTVVAHIAKDGHYFIKPDLDQVRSLSCREVARIQSFPDDYFFEGSMGSIFRQIGNAVPPLMAQRIADGIRIRLNQDTIEIP